MEFKLGQKVITPDGEGYIVEVFETKKGNWYQVIRKGEGISDYKESELKPVEEDETLPKGVYYQDGLSSGKPPTNQEEGIEKLDMDLEFDVEDYANMMWEHRKKTNEIIDHLNKLNK